MADAFRTDTRLTREEVSILVERKSPKLRYDPFRSALSSFLLQDMQEFVELLHIATSIYNKYGYAVVLEIFDYSSNYIPNDFNCWFRLWITVLPRTQ